MKLIIFKYYMYNLIENIIMGVFSEEGNFVYEREMDCTGTVFKAHKTHANTVENHVLVQPISHFPFPLPVS